MKLLRSLHGAIAPAVVFSSFLLAATQVPASAQGMGAAGAVFTATNGANANSVIAFRRSASGKLEQAGVYPTGGVGSGGGLGNQGALALDRPGRHLFAVNAGSDSVSVFDVGPQGLQLVDVAPSGGSQPISVTVHGDLVYVLNEGGDGNVAGLRMDAAGNLSPLAGSSRPLSIPGADPAQIAFTPNGQFLVVTEKDTNSIVTYSVGDDGLAAGPVVTPSEGATPFGFSFGRHSRLLVSEATGGAPGASTVSSYDILPDGTVEPVTSALPTTQSAACWLIATVNGRFAYVTNTGSGTVTGLGLDNDGSLSLLQQTGVAATAGIAPIDAAVSRNGRYLYVLNAGDDTLQGYEIGAHGELTEIETTSSLSPTMNGLVAL